MRAAATAFAAAMLVLAAALEPFSALQRRITVRSIGGGIMNSFENCTLALFVALFASGGLLAADATLPPTVPHVVAMPSVSPATLVVDGTAQFQGPDGTNGTLEKGNYLVLPEGAAGFRLLMPSGKAPVVT